MNYKEDNTMEEINRKWKAIWEKREPDSSSITDFNDAKMYSWN